MANPEHVAILDKGVEAWNQWRKENPAINPDLSGIDLQGKQLYKTLSSAEVELCKSDYLLITNEQQLIYSHFGYDNIIVNRLLLATLLSTINFDKVDLTGANLTGCIIPTGRFAGANLTEAILSTVNLNSSCFSQAILDGADLSQADLSNSNFRSSSLINTNLNKTHLFGALFADANLSEAKIIKAFLTGANFIRAKLEKANLRDSIIEGACFYNANLSGADLTGCRLINADLRSAQLIGCMVYGTSIWDIKIENAIQADIRITPPNQPSLTIDNLEVAQFIYLLLHNNKLRDVIDTITSKVVLILGRFTPERKDILDAIREELRRHNYSPVLFDFEKPASRDLTETISLLARMARFVIADLTDPMSIPHELASIVPTLRSVPVVPIIQGDGQQYSMFDDFQRSYAWVLPTYHYADLDSLLSTISAEIIRPAEEKVIELRG